MCPVCIAAAALFAAKATAVGGVTVLAVKKLFSKNSASQFPTTNPPEEDRHD